MNHTDQATGVPAQRKKSPRIFLTVRGTDFYIGMGTISMPHKPATRRSGRLPWDSRCR